MSSEQTLNDILQHAIFDETNIMNGLDIIDGKVDDIMTNTDNVRKYNELCKSNLDSFNIKYLQLISDSNGWIQTATTNNTIVNLSQSDFTSGTYLINQPGVYRLAEDIVFNPNSRWSYDLSGNRTDTGLDWFPTPTQLVSGGGPYDDKAFRFGFFAAIVITATNVVLDLNGYTLSQHPEHALQQRFFSLIEVSSAPFPPQTGPATFSDIIYHGSNIVIRNGHLGKNSHHSIHGNDAQNMIIEDLTIENYEVAGISLNTVSNVMIKNVVLNGNNKNVPVTGNYSAGRFTRLFANKLIPTLSGATKTEGENKLAALEALMDQAFDEIIGLDGQTVNGTTTVTLFKNVARILDANSYGILLHGKFSVEEFADGSMVFNSNDLYLKDVTVRNVENNIKEIVGLGNAGAPMTGPDGAVFQIAEVVDGNGRYVGHVLSDLQLFIAEHAVTADHKGRVSITPEVVAWSKNATDIADVMTTNGYEYICNGDRMHHVNKGTLGLKLDGLNRLTLDNVTVYNIHNHSPLGSELCGPYETSHSGQGIKEGSSSGNARGVSLAACKNVCINDCTVDEIHSDNGNAIAVDIFSDSKKVEAKDVTVSNVTAGSFTLNGDNIRIWRGTSFDGSQVPYNADLPNLIPHHCGVHVCDSCQDVNLYDVTINGENWSPAYVSMHQMDIGMSTLNS